MAQDRTTANEPVRDIDPGGSRPTKPAKPPTNTATTQHIETGDRNTMKNKAPHTDYERHGEDKS